MNHVLLDLIGWCLFGLIAGGIARLLYPGPNRLGCLGTIALGVAGSLAGGFACHLLFASAGEPPRPAGLIGAVLGGLVLLYLGRKLAAPHTS